MENKSFEARELTLRTIKDGLSAGDTVTYHPCPGWLTKELFLTALCQYYYFDDDAPKDDPRFGHFKILNRRA